MRYLQTIVVEDEPQNMALMQSFLKSYCPSIQVIASCSSYDQAKETLSSTAADLLFLDVELDKGTTLELLNEIDVGSTQIIFVTAHKEYATQVFRFNTTDYLLKPLDIEELVAAVHRATLRIEKEEFIQPEQVKAIQQANAPNDKNLDFIPIANMDKVNFVKLREVLFCKSSGRYTEFHLTDGRQLIASKPLGNYETKLANKHFFRVHNSYLVNLTHLAGITRKGGAYCEMNTGFLVPISRRRLSALTEKLASS